MDSFFVRLGQIKGIESIRIIEEGEEVLVHYGYKPYDKWTPEWYNWAYEEHKLQNARETWDEHLELMRGQRWCSCWKVMFYDVQLIGVAYITIYFEARLGLWMELSQYFPKMNEKTVTFY